MENPVRDREQGFRVVSSPNTSSLVLSWAADEPQASAGADVEPYEQLRRRALEGEPEGWRLGLGCCATGASPHGWAWQAPVPAAPVAAPPDAPRIASDELVGVLASMALVAIGR